MLELLSLKGKVALVTGGCQNLGLDAATALGEAGAELAVTSRERSKAEKKARELSAKFQREVLPLPLDVTDEVAVEKAFAEIVRAYGRIDILVNNAGGGQQPSSGNLEDESLLSWNAYVAVNLTGTFLCCREAARVMIPRRSGAIINIASITSLVGRDRSVYAGTTMKNSIAYTASKAGIIGFTYDCAACLGKHGIRVNAISPGGFLRGQPDSFVSAYSARTMLGRMGTDGLDMKGAVVFLASDAAGYITGHNLYVDGGFTRFK